METKELKIDIPAGYEIDRENSTFECIKFKPKSLTYEDVAKSLFKHDSIYNYYIVDYGKICYCSALNNNYVNTNNATSKKQLEKLLAINKLMNVAKYLNGDWQPVWDCVSNKYFIYIAEDNILNIAYHTCIVVSGVYFKTEELARQAIDILGEDTIYLALSTAW